MTTHKLPIEYNTDAPIGVVSNDAYIFLLLGKLFNNFRIISPLKQDWLKDITSIDAEVTALNTAQKSQDSISKIVSSKRFVDLFKADSRRKYVMYSPLDPPYKINPLAYLMNSPTIAHAYENKRYFRDEFSDLIRMPEYEIKYMNELDRAASYKNLRERFEGPFVLQDEESSGSKGTHAVHNEDDYLEAVKNLKRFSRGRTIVASKFVHGEVSSIQVCITKYGIFSGGIQKQLVDSKYLCNPKLAGASKWCGGEVGGEYPDIVQHQAQEIATIVGSELSSHGYKGIFGIDIIVTPENEVYAIEINARLTGYSHVISDLQMMEGKIPFLLLHILELGNYKYEVTDLEALPSVSRYKKSSSLMIINNPLDEPFVLGEYIRPGMYRYKDGEIKFIKPASSVQDLSGDDSFLLFCRYNPGDPIDSGKRIVKIMKLGKSMMAGDLTPKTQAIVAATKKAFDLPS